MIEGEDTQPFASPEEALAHYGVKGMKWGVRREKQYRSVASKLTKRAEKLEHPNPSVGTKVAYGPKILRDIQAQTDRATAAEYTQKADKIKAKREAKEGGDLPSFQDRLGRVTRTDHPQVLSPQKEDTPQAQVAKSEKKGLSRNQKIALTFGAATAAAAGYYAYQHYTGNKLPIPTDFDALLRQHETEIAGLKLPARWDVSGLKSHPLSKQALGDLAGGEFALKLKNPEDLVINTSRGFADILPKNGLPSPYAVKQHDSVVRVLEEMRKKYPAVRNMNVEVLPMSRMEGAARPGVHMSVLTMRAGEARVMYNDLMDGPPSAATIRANAKHLPGLGKKDYVAYHEMGHLLAAAHGDIPPAFDVLRSDTTPTIGRKWAQADPLLHRRTMAKHGFTFKELSKISRYAATEPAEAVAELAGHYFHPEMRARLTPDQIQRAEAMFNEMGGVVT